jgi:hypothetical protein
MHNKSKKRPTIKVGKAILITGMYKVLRGLLGSVPVFNVS